MWLPGESKLMLDNGKNSCPLPWPNPVSKSTLPKVTWKIIVFLLWSSKAISVILLLDLWQHSPHTAMCFITILPGHTCSYSNTSISIPTCSLSPVTQILARAGTGVARGWHGFIPSLSPFPFLSLSPQQNKSQMTRFRSLTLPLTAIIPKHSLHHTKSQCPQLQTGLRMFTLPPSRQSL